MFGRRISFLLPFSIIQLCFASEDKHLPKRPLITDDEIQEDMKAVDLAIQAPWVERNPSGLEKPEAPKQVDLELLAEALDIAMEMKPDDKQVLLKMDKLNEWANEEEGNTKIVEDNSKAKLSSNLTKSIEEEKKEAKEDYITLSELFKLDEKEEIKEEIKEEEQCSEKDKQKFLEGKSIESPIQQQNRTETIFENINGISGNWWHFATDTQPIEEKKIENKDDQPAFVMVVLDEGNEDEEKEKKKVDKEENLKKEEDKVEKEKKEEDKAENEVKKVIEEALIKSILEESNENEVFAQIQKQKELRAERPSEMVIIDMTSNEDSYKKSEERKIEDKIEAEKDEQKEQQMMDIIEVINMDKESDEDEDDNSSPLEEKIEEEEKSSGILGVLSNLLFGGRRFKREAFPFPAIPNSTKIVDPFEVNSGEKIESMKIIKSFAGRMNMGGKDIEFSSTKWEVTKDLGKKEEENKEVLKENLGKGILWGW
uniref:Uncharacterized protein n=1 Tax=Meloidogyne hapla TaxID=6305 RepID=A0A1I8B650_MELHA